MEVVWLYQNSKTLLCIVYVCANANEYFVYEYCRPICG